MRLISIFCLGLLLVAGCAGLGGSARHQIGEPVARHAMAPDVASLLLAAGEGDWRKEVDIGPMDFDEEGLPVVAKGEVKEIKARRFSVKLGFAPGLDQPDSHMDIDLNQEGPVAGFGFSMGPRAAKFAIEVGMDYANIRGEYQNSNGLSFKSDLFMPRIDAMYFLQDARKASRVYGLLGYRRVFESGHFQDSGEADYSNEEGGFAVGGGFVKDKWDFRWERLEISENESRLVMNQLTAGFRF